MKIIITEENAKTRADVLVANAATQYSRAALGKLFDMGSVLLGDQPAKRGDKPKIGQILTVDLTPIQQEPDVVPLPVLYEDGDVIVINKPEGIISHSRGRYWQEASVASFIRDKTKGMTGDRAGIVHRLDRATSGVMIAAKTEAAQRYLQKQFADRTTQKTYVALVTGVPKVTEARIVAPLQRHPKHPKLFMVHEDGKQAETAYKLLQTNNAVSLLELHPLTGRTHQLRVHLSYIGHAIIGDELYAPGANEDRMYLHAHTLQINLPGNRPMLFEAPLPSSFNKRLRQL